MKDDSGDLKRSLFAVGEAVLGAGILVCLGMWGGNYLDEKFHTTPWLSISLSVLGAILGLVRLVQKAMTLDKDKS